VGITEKHIREIIEKVFACSLSGRPEQVVKLLFFCLVAYEKIRPHDEGELRSRVLKLEKIAKNW